MKILLSNDDGYQAPGIVALYEAIKDLGDVEVVAPEHNNSAKSNALTLHSPLYVHLAGNGRAVIVPGVGLVDMGIWHWMYQHEWIVVGATLGWWHGAEALRILIQDDAKAQTRWGVGSRSAQVARRALAGVEARTR